MAERLVPAGDALLAVLSAPRGEVWSAPPGECALRRVLPEFHGIKAAAFMRT